MKRILITFTLTIVAVVALAFILGNPASGESGWPIRVSDGEPTEGGNWMGNGSMSIPDLGIEADWYNATNGDEDWVIGDGDDVLRSFSAFDFQHDLVIESGGILRLDSVLFNVNNSDMGHSITIEAGGALYITNSTLSLREIIVEGELYIDRGNSTTGVYIDSDEGMGIYIGDGSIVELKNASFNGYGTLVYVFDDDAIIQGCTFSTSTVEASCIMLGASGVVFDNTFNEGSTEGSFAIIALEGVNSQIYNNTFSRFKAGATNIHGLVIISLGPIELWDNNFKAMESEDISYPYFIEFIGVEPTDHDGQPVWETNRFRGTNKDPGKHRVNIFKQSWYVDVEVTNLNTGNPIDGANVEVKDQYDSVVASDGTDVDGMVYLEVPEFVVSALNDGDAGDSPKTPTDLNPYDIEASKEGESAMLDNETIDDNVEFNLDLELVESDFGIINIQFPAVFIAGTALYLDATVFNLGYDRTTEVTVEFYLNDGSRAQVHLGDVDILMDQTPHHAYLDAMIDLSYAGTMISFTAIVDGYDDNATNDEYTSEEIRVNTKPTVTITAPADGEEVDGLVNITGTAADDLGLDSVMITVVGVVDDAEADGTASWYYLLDVTSLANTQFQVIAKAIDSNGSASDEATITITVKNKPLISIDSHDDGDHIYGSNDVTMIGTTQKLDTPIEKVTLSIDGGPEMDATQQTGDWSQWYIDLMKGPIDRLNDLSDGEHTFTATVYDDDGLVNTDTVTLIVHAINETTNPIITTTGVTGALTLNEDGWLEGTATDDYMVKNIQYKINDGNWLNATEMPDLGTATTTYRIRLQVAKFDVGANILYVRAFDDDANTTISVGVTVPDITGVDLSITDVSLLNEDGKELKKGDLKTGNTIKVLVHVKKTGSDNIPKVVVKLYIDGVESGSKTQENVSVDFDATLTITLSTAMIGKQSYELKVDPGKIVPETDEENNVQAGELPGKIEAGANEDDGESDDDSGFIPGFEPIMALASIGIAGLLIVRRKRRD